MAFLSDMKGVARDSLIYGLSSSLSRMMSLITAPIVTRILVPADYGVIALIHFAIGFFVIFAGMNIGSGVSYYYYKEKNSGSGKEDIVLSSGLYMTMLFSALISGLVYLYAPVIANILELRADGAVSGYDLVQFLRLAAVGLFFSLFVTSTQTILRLWRRPMTFFRLECLNIILGVLLVFLFIVWMRTGVIGMFYVGIIVPAIASVLGLWVVRRAIRPHISLVVLGPIFAYCLPQLPGVFVNWAQSQLGRGFVNYFSSLSELGLYSIAFSLSSLFVIAVSAFRMAYDPYALSVMDREDARSIYARAYDLYIPVFAFLAGGLIAFAKPIIMILTPEDYHAAYSMVVYFVIAGLYMGANNILGTGIWISRRTSFTSYAQIISFSVLVIFSAILVPIYHGAGAAIAYMLGAVAQSFSYYIFAQKLWHVPYDYWRSHAVIAFVLSVCLLQGRVIEGVGFWGASLSGFITCVIIASGVFMIGVSAKNKNLVRQRGKSWLLEKGVIRVA